MRIINSSRPIAKALFLPCLALCLAGNAPIQDWRQAFVTHHLDQVIQLPATKKMVIDFKNDKNPYYVIYGKSLLKKTITTKYYRFLDDDGGTAFPPPAEPIDHFTIAIFRNDDEPALLYTMPALDFVKEIERNKRDIELLDGCWPIKNVQHGLYLATEDAGLIEYFDKKWKRSQCGD